MNQLSLLSVSLVFAFSTNVSAHGLHRGLSQDSNQQSSRDTKIGRGAVSGSTHGSSAPDSAVPEVITKIRQLTFEGPRAGEGYFSHDGRLLIYQSERLADNPFYQIFLLNRDTGKTARLSPGHGKTTCAWVHPSKEKALFSSTHLDPKVKEKTAKEFEDRKSPVKGKYSWSFDETFDIFEAPIAAAVKTGAAVAEKSLKRLTKELGYDAEASYSPNGIKIAFASNRAGYVETLSAEEQKIFEQDPSYMMDLYLMDADGSNIERLTTARGYDGGPFFSSDGTMLTWRRFSANGQYAEIMVMDLKTRKETQLTKWKAMSWAPFFHPSGDYVIFTSNKLGYSNFELFIVDTEGKREPVRVSHLDGFDGLPVFLPSGHEISWTRRDEKGESQIYLAEWDDGLARELLGISRRAPTVTELSREVEISDLKAWVSYLSSPALKGRSPGSPEERQYSEAIGKAMRAMGLEPLFGKSYLQPFEFTSGVRLGPLNRLRLRESGQASDLKVDEDWRPLSISKSGDVMEAPIAFAGYGIMAPASDKQAAFDSYDGLDVSGKWVVVLRDLPADIPPEKRFHFHLYSRPQHKALVAKQKGAVGLILVDSPLDKTAKALQSLKFEGAGEVGIPVVHVSQEAAGRIFKGATAIRTKIATLDRGELFNETLKTSIGGKIDIAFEKSVGLNVAGRLPGRFSKSTGGAGPLIIGGHGDHLGLGENAASLARTDEQGQIHAGADDNASGVAALLELAHEMTGSRNLPERDVIFAVWSAEELGVLGSTYFLKEWKGPKPYAYINLDMVGRLRDALYVQGLGSAKEWRTRFEGWIERLPMIQHSLVGEARLVSGLDPYLPTDAMAFYVKEIPILSFFTGSHAEYHSPRDTYQTLNFAGLKSITETVGFLAKDLSRRDSVLTWVKVESGRPQGDGQSRSFRLYLGTVPDYSQEGVKGVKISGTSKDSPAETAGLKPGDVIVGLGGIKIDSIYDYVYCLQALKADVTVPIQVKRGGEMVELKITPKLKTGG
jgi:Tol biopolymer transport system component/Zn-dependent M28 family amino/carboxypeptidase